MTGFGLQRTRFLLVRVVGQAHSSQIPQLSHRIMVGRHNWQKPIRIP